MVCLVICFPGETRVTTDQGEKRMDELNLSDKVLTLSKKRGDQKWTPFYTWGHRESNRVADFVVLRVEDGNELQISSDHLLFVVGDNGKRVAKKAGEICRGDKLYHLGGNGDLETLRVADIRMETFTGVFAPFTMSGDFLANGFLVSCYANVEEVDVAHAALSPLRAWYKIRQHSNNKKTTHCGGKDGINGYALNLMKFRDSLPASVQRQICAN